jgi:hypothetical protein
VAKQTVINFIEKASRPYEQSQCTPSGVSPLEMYARRWNAGRAVWRASADGATDPVGTVQFLEGTTLLDTESFSQCIAHGECVATFNWVPTLPGNSALTAEFIPTIPPVFAPSSSAPFTVTIQPAPFQAPIFPSLSGLVPCELRLRMKVEQSQASFLARQRRLEHGHGRSNCGSLFAIAKIPSDNHIRDMLDPAEPMNSGWSGTTLL